jgi:hypothetical protein
LVVVFLAFFVVSVVALSSDFFLAAFTAVGPARTSDKRMAIVQRAMREDFMEISLD